MKKLFFLFGLAGIFTLASCSIGNSDSDYSPQFVISSVTLNGTTVSTVDTIKVGDTLAITATASGVSKPLVGIQVTNESAYTTVSFPELATILNEGVTYDSSTGYFNFGGLNAYSFSFTTKLVAIQANKSGTSLTYVVASTSQYSPTTYTIKLPIKAAS